MNRKRKLSISEIVNDIRSGLTDAELMARYQLSSRGIQRAFEKLLEIGAITRAELENRNQLGDDSIFFESMREIPRNYLVVPIPVYDTGRSDQPAGRIRDLTEKGLGIVDIKTKVNEIRVFSVLPDDFVTVPAFSFEAVCRWLEKGEHESPVAGFEITTISDDSLVRLRQLITDLTFGEC